MKVDALFRATEDIVLPGGQKGMVRALSDSERTHRQRHALLRSHEVAEELRDETSERYRMEIAPLATVEDPGAMVTILLQLRRTDLQREALTLYPNQFIPFPDEATDIEQREVLERRQETEAAIRESRAEHISERMTEIREKWMQQPYEEMRDAALKAAVDVFARQELLRAAEVYTVWAGTYVYEDQENSADPKRLFKSPEDIFDIPTEVIQHLLEEVDKVDSIDVWELQKNSLTGSGTASTA